MSRLSLLILCVLNLALPLKAELPDFPEPKSLEKRKKNTVPSLVIEDETVKMQNKKNVGKDLETFSTEVVNRIDRVVSRKGFTLWGEPWTIQGIPLLFPTSSNGFHIGLHAKMHNIMRQDPHKIEISGQVLASDEGRYKHFIGLDIPYLFNDQYRFTGRIAYNRDISFKYYGIGNDTVIDHKQDDSDYYGNTRSGPSVQFSFMRYHNKIYRMGPIIGLKWTDVTVPENSLLQKEHPSGEFGGKTNYFGFALVRDTLDFEPYPTKGTFNELFVYWYSPWLGTTYNYQRYTYTFRVYVPLHPKLVLAHRALCEVVAGDVPFFEMGSVGGSDSTLGLGGDRYVRGYEGNRFIDKYRLFFGWELRWDPYKVSYAGQDFIFGVVPFVDFGRVWGTLNPFYFGKLHASTGLGLRILWNKRFVIRADWAMNEERKAVFIELGNSF